MIMKVVRIFRGGGMFAIHSLWVLKRLFEISFFGFSFNVSFSFGFSSSFSCNLNFSFRLRFIFSFPHLVCGKLKAPLCPVILCRRVAVSPCRH